MSYSRKLSGAFVGTQRKRGVKTGGVYYPRDSSLFDAKMAQYRAARPRAGYSTVPRTRGWAAKGEMKYFDTELANNAIAACTTSWGTNTRQDPSTTIDLGAAAVATPLCLFAPTVGSALNQRIGRKVYVKKIKLAMNISCAAQTLQSAADALSHIRILLVQDMQTNAAQMTPSSLLNDASASQVTVLSKQNPNGFGRFRILKDKKLNIANLNMVNDTGATGGIVQSSYGRTFKIQHEFLKPVEVNFNATNGGTVSDIIDNSFHVIIGASNIGFAPVVNYYCRVCYKE